MAKQTIGEFLATQRKAKGFTQQYVADMLGISNKTLSAWETNKAYPDILVLPALAELYGVTADEILKGERSFESANQTELSDKAQNKLYKSKLARYSTKNAILLSVGICAAIIFTLRATFLGILTLFAVPLLLISAVAIVIVYTVLISSAKSLELSADDEPASVHDNFVLNVTAKCAQVVCVLGICWFGCGVFTILAICAEWNVFGLLVFFVEVPFIVGLVSVILASKHRAKAYKSYASELQLKVYKYNNNLAAMCAGIPSIVAVGLIVVEVVVMAVLNYFKYPYSESSLLICLLIAPTLVVCLLVGAIVYGCKRKKLVY